MERKVPRFDDDLERRRVFATEDNDCDKYETEEDDTEIVIDQKVSIGLWQPMNTAPRYDKEIMLRKIDGTISPGYWDTWVQRNEYDKWDNKEGWRDSESSVAYEEKAFSQAVINLLKTPEMALEMGKKGRIYVEKHRSYKILADLVEQQYFRICKKRGNSSSTEFKPSNDI